VLTPSQFIEIAALPACPGLRWQNCTPGIGGCADGHEFPECHQDSSLFAQWATLMRHLAAIARKAGLKQLVAEVLPENVPMMRVFEKSGLPLTTKREPQVLHVRLDLG
jgi:hypothetical protein